MLKLSFSIVILSILLTPSVARQRIAASETPPAADTVARTEPPASDGTAALPRPAADTVSAMTLDACMAYAVEHNPNVRQQIYANRNYRQEYIASIAALVPSAHPPAPRQVSAVRSTPKPIPTPPSPISTTRTACRGRFPFSQDCRESTPCGRHVSCGSWASRSCNRPATKRR